MTEIALKKEPHNMNLHVRELFDLSGKVALVTGGAGWLGTAISEALAQAGAEVAIVDYNADAVDKAVGSFKENSLEVIGIVADVMQEKSLRDCIDKVAADCKRLDILVNCAYTGPVPELDQATLEDYDKGFHNGPSAYGVAAQQAAKHMRKVGGGTIINIGSMYGIVTGYPEVYEGLTKPNSVVYQASKAAVIHMTRYMAVYWARDNIRVNCLTPGAFPNASVQKQIPEFAKRLSAKTPMGRIGKPYELKGATLFLASDASSYVTGQNIVIDGGWTAW